MDIPPVVVVILDDDAKHVTKRYSDGRSLRLLVRDRHYLYQKQMTYQITWDLEAMVKERTKGADCVVFKYWEKQGYIVSFSYYGTYLIGVIVTLDYTIVPNPNIISVKRHTALANDVTFPIDDLKKLPMQDGYSSQVKRHPELSSNMHDAVVKALIGFQEH